MHPRPHGTDDRTTLKPRRPPRSLSLVAAASPFHGGLHTLVCGRNRHPGVPSPQSPGWPRLSPGTLATGRRKSCFRRWSRSSFTNTPHPTSCSPVMSSSPGVNHPGPPRPCKCATATTLLAAMPCCLVAASWRQLFTPRVPLASLPSSSRSPRPSLIVIPDNKDLFRRAATMHRRIAMRGAARDGHPGSLSKSHARRPTQSASPC